MTPEEQRERLGEQLYISSLRRSYHLSLESQMKRPFYSLTSLRRELWLRAADYVLSLLTAQRKADAAVAEKVRSSGENTDEWTITRDRICLEIASAIESSPLVVATEESK